MAGAVAEAGAAEKATEVNPPPGQKSRKQPMQSRI
jgi:hypothetical protein